MPNRPGNDDRITATNPTRTTQTACVRTAVRTSSNSPRARSNRGFASMDREKQHEIASKGGQAAHAKGTAHEFDSGEAREAGRKGGMAVSRNRDHMAAIGRRGGEARGQSRTRGSSANQHRRRWQQSGRQLQNSRAGLTSSNNRIQIVRSRSTIRTKASTPTPGQSRWQHSARRRTSSATGNDSPHATKASGELTVTECVSW